MHDLLDSRAPDVVCHYGMMRYHLGWVDAHFQPQTSPTGKRLRPLFCLLACAAVGGDPTQALPAAAALEFLHNFSLVHDDTEDGDAMRRHQPTVWKLWGVPQAINVGDALFALAFAALQRLPQRGVSPERTLRVLDLFTQTCLALAEGQHLDLCFEQHPTISIDEYLRMIQGKTAALVGASVGIGALIGGASTAQAAALQRFGEHLGLAFQIRDDLLGIWGDPEETGKTGGQDILRRKKSLPMVYALNDAEIGTQLRALLATDVGAEQLPQALACLEQAGARSFAEAQLQA
jgi:geranylgeranyl diphosphate synthase type I